MKKRNREKETAPGAGPGRKSRAIFLDRDGVLNRAVLRNGKPHPPPSVAELVITPGAKGMLGDLKARGYKLVMVTNQPDVSRGITTRETVDEINRTIASQLPIDHIFVCPHSDEDGCDCRKPKAGMLQEAADHHGIDLASSFMVGDSWRDVDAGHNAGCQAVLIDLGYEERQAHRPPEMRVQSLAEATNWILENSRKEVAR